MELVFLVVLILLMVFALMSGFPVGFALPGSAILSIGAAALFGWLFEGDVSAYFAHGGPIEWLSAGVTNFRSLYWVVERDTLIAVPLFVFMGIMLQKSRIAEDLLVAMARMFGSIPGGLGISVVFVGALLAATTGIVGATVIAMGLISLPAMLRNNYSRPLAAGTICASGTLGQIIPPSVVLIILADQLASSADIASTTRKAEYKAATGEIIMPSEFDVVSASAGDMFMGAFVPGIILVAIYMAYILVHALLNPKSAPPVPYEGRMDLRFYLGVLLALVPPLTLILAVLGSILAGIATVNQAGAIGAIGAAIMGGYRLTAGRRTAFLPAVIAIVSIVELLVVLSVYDINVKNITSEEDVRGITLALVGTVGLLVAIVWSLWRAHAIEDTLKGVMVETAKTTSMVFIILIGAAMLTSAFRAFGGEDLVRDYLNSLPGGFWTQFIVVMAVIFLLGFFLDFIEIAVVVIPIVAPILLADPSANITAVWFGVMVGLNIQTSFLTPPFGFALFYLRGVAPAVVQTLEIYRGAAVFIVLQLFGLAIAGTFPSLVNYLPNRVYLSSETAPPPMNPKLQHCLEEYVFARYDENGDALRAHIERGRGHGRRLPAGRDPQEVRGQLRARAGEHRPRAGGEGCGRGDGGVPAGISAAARGGAAQAGESPQAPEAPRAPRAGTLAADPRRDRDRCPAQRGESGDHGRGSGDGRDRGEHPGGLGRGETALRRAPECPEEGPPRVSAECRRGVPDHRRSASADCGRGRAAWVRADACEPRRRRRERAGRAGDGGHQGGGTRARQGRGQQPDHGEIVESPSSTARQVTGSREGREVPRRGARALCGGRRLADPRGAGAAARTSRV